MNIKSSLYQELRRQGYDLDGWTAWSPTWGLIGGGIDAEVCAKSSCKCGHLGLEYHPFIKERRYMPFSRCPSCGKVEEF
jgi:hypothetical protein